PALDIILFRPADPAHSEFNHITKLLHQQLLNQILKPTPVIEYAWAMRKF
ncbi:hypothetical protein K470DRAFT_223294, partial [Piedraia hortae CBS 480.64]